MRKAGPLVVLVLAAELLWLVPSASAHTGPFDAAFRETLGRATSRPCAHFLCGTGTVSGYGSATSITDITLFEASSNGCADVALVRTITLDADGSTLNVTESGVVCFPGRSSTAPGAQVSFGNPGGFEGTYTIGSGTGVFQDATGAGSSSLFVAGNAGHSSLTGTISLP